MNADQGKAVNLDVGGTQYTLHKDRLSHAPMLDALVNTTEFATPEDTGEPNFIDRDPLYFPRVAYGTWRNSFMEANHVQRAAIRRELRYYCVEAPVKGDFEWAKGVWMFLLNSVFRRLD